jgi:hypothetical protein
MPGQYPTSGSLRPRLCDEGKQADATTRLYLCARCRIQVLICSCCDRGNIYCEQGCAEESRRSKRRASTQRYQSTLAVAAIVPTATGAIVPGGDNKT